MATNKLLKPTNVTIAIPAFTDQPDQRVNSNCIDKEADAINALNDHIATKLETDGVIKLVKRFTFSNNLNNADGNSVVNVAVSGRLAVCAFASCEWYAGYVTRCTVYDNTYVTLAWHNNETTNATTTGTIIVFYI